MSNNQETPGVFNWISDLYYKRLEYLDLWYKRLDLQRQQQQQAEMDKRTTPRTPSFQDRVSQGAGIFTGFLGFPSNGGGSKPPVVEPPSSSTIDMVTGVNTKDAVKNYTPPLSGATNTETNFGGTTNITSSIDFTKGGYYDSSIFPWFSKFAGTLVPVAGDNNKGAATITSEKTGTVFPQKTENNKGATVTTNKTGTALVVHENQNSSFFSNMGAFAYLGYLFIGIILYNLFKKIK